jgi:hypothetical protein
MRQPTTTAGPDNPGCQDFIPGAGAQIRLSRDMRMVVVRETLVSRIQRVGQVLPLQGVYRFKTPQHSRI